jgi:16S rRNA (adenine1518-N6/adenine1519-N6)-dimethyltransferase
MSAPRIADDLATPGGTARVLRAFGVRPRKRWGQHFLVSVRALQQILSAAELSIHDAVLEVGAGLGTLTSALAPRVRRVIAVEVDATLVPALRAAVAAWDNVQVICADIMTLDRARLFGDDGGPRKVVANLPYNLASALVVALLEQPLGVSRLVVTVQREVAARMAARPASADYGLLSVAVQYRAEASIVEYLPASAFFPAPDVESAVVRLDVRAQPACVVADEALFFRVVRAAFGQRRKTIRNALAGGVPMSPAQAAEACRRAGIAPMRRGETLDLREFASLTDAVAPMLSGQRNAHRATEGVPEDSP